ncbi:FmdB family zinc ribbon protein [Arthrobacter sp. SX1312]|uniref:FmdB family zinc ribbon protein n=1 Tax=Arthrobacter sp. SX1312 TaxID=2058896 RepID=UPI000CE2E7CB|nr:zinc ribbon domain-containing protein [Arthrobacter sp. SX1312]
MPIYEYRCPRCEVYEVIRGMGEAPAEDACPTCGQPARRKISAPHVSRTGTPAFQLIDSTMRSASDPRVVSGALPSTGTNAGPPYSSNPLHQKLPRP